MIDFLKTNPWCSLEQYKWQLTVGQIRLSSIDYSHNDYSHSKSNKTKGAKSHKGKRTLHISNPADLDNINNLGIPIIKKPNN